MHDFPDSSIKTEKCGENRNTGTNEYNHKKHEHVFYDFSSTKRGVFVHEGIKNGGSCTKQGVFVHEGIENGGSCTKQGVFVHEVPKMARW